MLLSDFLKTLNFVYARNSSEFIGTRQQNPSIILEDNVPQWIQSTSLEDLQVCVFAHCQIKM